MLAVKSRLRTDACPSSVPKNDLGRSLVVRMSWVPTGYTIFSTRRNYGSWNISLLLTTSALSTNPLKNAFQLGTAPIVTFPSWERMKSAIGSVDV